MALYNKRISQGRLAVQQIEAVIACKQIEGIVLTSSSTSASTSSSTSDSNSELSIVLSSRYLSLEEEW
jgi:hypothetical protein